MFNKTFRTYNDLMAAAVANVVTLYHLDLENVISPATLIEWVQSGFNHVFEMISIGQMYPYNDTPAMKK